MPKVFFRYLTVVPLCIGLFMACITGNVQAKEIVLSWKAGLSNDAVPAVGRTVSRNDGKASLHISMEGGEVIAEVAQHIGIDDTYYQERVNREVPIRVPNIAGIAGAVVDTDRWLRDELVYSLDQMMEGLGLDVRDKVAIICNLASSLPYESSTRIYKLPVQTLYEERADCMDKALLALWLLEGLNYTNDDVDISVGIVGVQKGAKHAGIIFDTGKTVEGARVVLGGNVFCVTDVTGPGVCHLGQWLRRLTDIEVGVLPGVRMQKAKVEW